MMKRQQVLADFGEFAIGSEDLDEVLTETCRLVGQALGTSRAKVLEIQEGGRELLVRAGVGWAPDVVGTVRLQMSDRSSETYAIKVAQPVISQDLAQERRFDFPEFMKKAGVVALVNVPIFVPGRRPYGVLQVDDTQVRAFGEDEIQFLRTYSMILGPVIDRLHLVDERARDREQLRSSEARHRLLIESWAQAVWEVDAVGVVTADSPSWRAYTGQTKDEWLGYGWVNAVHPQDRAFAEQQWRAAIAAGTPVDAEFRLHVPGGEWRWTNVRAAPVLDAKGAVEKWAGMNIDIDRRKRAEAALRESEQRQRALIEGVPQLVWRASQPGSWTWASPQWTEFNDQNEEESHGWGWLEALHPDDRDTARAAWSHAVEQGRFEADYRICAHKDGTYRWFQTRATPIYDGSGEIVEWLGTSTDVDDRRALQDRQQVLVAELQHRTFNLMSMVRSLADATIRSSATLEEFKFMFRDRIDALARVQRLLSRLKEKDRVTFDELIRSELDAAGVVKGDDDRVSLVGPPGVALRSRTVQTFAMALHELTTNAVKYGALKQPGGHLEVRWHIEIRQGKPWLHVEWQETGVSTPPADALPKGTGNGRRLIEEALPYQLRAETSYVMTVDGIRCSIALPLSASAHAEISHGS